MTIETVELDGLGLTYGDATRIAGTVSPDPVELGGQTYVADPAETGVRLEVSRTSTGYALRLRFEVGLVGPCVRCLEPAVASVAVDVREVDQPPEPTAGRRAGSVVEEGEDEMTAAELVSPYVENGVLDLRAWTHDAPVLSLPNQILCRPDCLGLCPGCGESLNGADPADHEHGQATDPRWAKLRELG